LRHAEALLQQAGVVIIADGVPTIAQLAIVLSRFRVGPLLFRINSRVDEVRSTAYDTTQDHYQYRKGYPATQP
jgi:hypothetical protein